MGPILVKKIFRRGSHITKIAKNGKMAAIFVVEKPLEMGPVDLQKIWKTKQNKTKQKQQQQQNVESAVFEGEKL